MATSSERMPDDVMSDTQSKVETEGSAVTGENEGLENDNNNADIEGVPSTTASPSPRSVSALSQRQASSPSQRSVSRLDESLPSPAGAASPAPTRPDSHKTQSRPESGSVTSVVSMGGRKSRSKLKPSQSELCRQVTFTVTVVAAVPTVHGDEEGGKNKSKRVVSDPKPQGFYHVEYYLLPTDVDPCKTDITLFGIAAKIYPEKQEAKVMKTWTDGNKTWIAWANSHVVTITTELLKKLVNHKLVVRIWDSRDKFGAKARFDQPRVFKFPSPKPGEDLDDISGVKTLTSKVSKAYIKRIPKLSNERPVPTVVVSESKLNKEKKNSDLMPQRGNPQSQTPTHNDNVPCLLLAHPDIEYKVYSKLVELAKLESAQLDRKVMRQALAATNTNKLPDLVHDRPLSGEDGGRMSTNEESSSIRNRKSAGGASANLRVRRQAKDKKAEQINKEAAEYAKKNGVASMHLSLASLFIGQRMSVARLENPVKTLLDGFVTVSIDRNLMTPEQRAELNPLSIRIKSVKSMPDFPVNYATLNSKCHPVTLSYAFHKNEDYKTKGRKHARDIYFDDINVVLLGPMARAELQQYLLGPPMEIRVRDREQLPQAELLTAVLFGNDHEDEKISNVGFISGKRTQYNALKERPGTWDPYGVAKVDMSDFLLGHKIINLQIPVLSCPLPDILGHADDRGKVIGIPGSVDGPNTPPMPPGNYMDSHTTIKIRLEVASPLVTPEQVASKPDLPNTQQCPFGRIVYVLDKRMKLEAQQILNFITDINSQGLGLDNLSPAILDAALSTYKLSIEQQKASDLDIITGFQLLDGKQYLFVLEGLRDNAIAKMWKALTKPNEGVKVLYNSNMSFASRLYGALDVDLTRVKLHEPLQIIVQQPLLYVRDTLPKNCFLALNKLDQLVQSDSMRNAVRNTLFPTADEVIAASREFGVPLTADDLITAAELEAVDEARSVDKQKSRSAAPITIREPGTRGRSRVHLKDDLDMSNPRYLEALMSRQKTADVDYVHGNMRTVMLESRQNTDKRKPKPVEHTRMKVPHNYSTHTYNSTELAKDVIRHHLDKDTLYTYNPEFHHSATFVPVNVKEEQLKEQRQHREKFVSNRDWIYPGVKNLRQCNQHPKAPDVAKVAELQDEWIANLNNRNKLDPTVEGREPYSWIDRRYDLDVWSYPAKHFEPLPEADITIMLAGQKLKDEINEAHQKEYVSWKNHVKVSDTSMHFHRLNPRTEAVSRGRNAASDLSKLESLLKDPPQKQAFVASGLKSGIPPLRVVHYPGVDVQARAVGVDVDKLTKESMAADISTYAAFNPGPLLARSWTMDCNRIPVVSYNHSEEGYFNVYHNERHNKKLYKRSIQPLQDKEYSCYLFADPDPGQPITTMPDSEKCQ